MKFTFENLGYIDKGGIEPGNLTIICGDNNTGKTYISYGIYGFLYNISRNPKLKLEPGIISDLLSNGKIKIDLNNYLNRINDIISENSTDFIEELPNVFSSSKSLFNNTKIIFELLNINYSISKPFEARISFKDKTSIIFVKAENSMILDIIIENDTNEKIPDLIVNDILTNTIFKIIINDKIKNPFVITSERTGASVFYKELDINKNILIEKILKTKNVDIPDLFFTDLSRYPISIKHNIDVIRSVKEVLNRESFIKKNNNEIFELLIDKFNELIAGKFILIGNDIYLEPKKLKKRKKSEPLPLHLASSASRSVLLLYIYINSIAGTNDILLIDEPELNLHPSKQMLMAKLLANLVNLGIDVLITTHSDYIIKEINNLIMLSNNFNDKERIMKDYDYNMNDILTPDKVKAYFTIDQQIKSASVDNFGIDMKLFDNTIYDLNKKSDDIYYSING